MLLFNPKCRCRSARPVADPGAGPRPPPAPAYSRSAGPSPGRQNRPGGTSNLALFSATGFLMLFTPSFQRNLDRQKNGRFQDSGTAELATPAKPVSAYGASPPGPPGKEVKIQGISVRATRKPSSLYRSPGVSEPRFAERSSLGKSLQEPPRRARTRQKQSRPVLHTLPSVGAPE